MRAKRPLCALVALGSGWRFTEMTRLVLGLVLVSDGRNADWAELEAHGSKHCKGLGGISKFDDRLLTVQSFRAVRWMFSRICSLGLARRAMTMRS